LRHGVVGEKLYAPIPTFVLQLLNWLLQLRLKWFQVYCFKHSVFMFSICNNWSTSIT